MTGLYVHIPFCLRRCEYCDFITDAGMTKIIPAYLNALEKEIQFTGWRVSDAYREISSIYFGGGTPSLVRSDQIYRLMESIRRHFTVLEDSEVTLEANPGTAKSIDFEGLVAAGVNRLSLGAQSFVESELRALGRIHSVQQTIETVNQARNGGFRNISLDLMFGIPTQTDASWQMSLKSALDLNVDHLSLYSLILEPGTPLFDRVEDGKVKLPEGDLVADMYSYAREMLCEAGFEQYEISNWARELSFESKHNKTYWLNHPYHGFGTAAHRRIGYHRSSNMDDTISYIDRMNRGEIIDDTAVSIAISNLLEIDWITSMKETLMLGLRLLREGVSERGFLARYGQDLESVFAKEIRHLMARGIVEWAETSNGRCLRLTYNGVMVGNQAFMEFI